MRKSEALKYRGHIESAVQSLPDNAALEAVTLCPRWASGVSYIVGFKIQQGGKLWRCIQAHTSQEGWEPENAASLWENVNETHAGTMDDPIPYDGNMALENGTYYIQNGVTYLCIRDTVNPVYNALSELVGTYTEII